MFMQWRPSQISIALSFLDFAGLYSEEFLKMLHSAKAPSSLPFRRLLFFSERKEKRGKEKKGKETPLPKESSTRFTRLAPTEKIP